MWYLFQLIVYGCIIYKYKTEIAPEAYFGHIMLFAYLVTFVVTWIVSKILDASGRLIRSMRTKPAGSVPAIRSGQKRLGRGTH